MKKPFLFALVAAIYIIFIVQVVNAVTMALPRHTIFIPMAVLGLFVLSAAIMGFLFLYEPLNLYMDNRKHEALVLFGKTVGVFACFVAIFVAILFIF